MRNEALRRCALASTGIRRKMHGDGKAVGFWRKMSGQSKRTRDKELLVSCSFSLLMKGQTLFSADHLAFKGLILLICRFSDV
jgi:hypothetical protein